MVINTAVKCLESFIMDHSNHIVWEFIPSFDCSIDESPISGVRS